VFSAQFADELMLEIEVSGSADLDFTFDELDDMLSRFSFNAAAADMLVVHALKHDEDSNSYTQVVERRVRTAALPETSAGSGRRSAVLWPHSDPDLKGLGVDIYFIELHHVTWDETRSTWPGGRILPLMAGHAFRVQADDLTP
jgi:hypothetical protein